MRRRHIAELTSVAVKLPFKEHTLGFWIKTELRVLCDAYPPIQEDTYEQMCDSINSGNVMEALKLLEVYVGTDTVLFFAKKVRVMHKEAKK
jgi:hypothetical protein